ncbi:MAG TPA: Uma2 family endonuclease [Anaerolineae bacterium]|nr:Uma2 family endonuclease [Anaerolineae bacterium]HQK14649.1 Uma2 family endonuclease [Anaerolineae bacterium]
MTIMSPKVEMPITMAVQHLRRSPQLPRYVQELESLLAAERARRERFYVEMSEDRKMEFINGEVFMHSPARWRHTVVVRNLTTLLDIYVSRHNLGCIGQENVLITLTRNDYEPDVVYFGPAKAQTLSPDQMKFPAPDLVVEVLSPSTVENDRGIKFVDYAAHGVAEYWIVDPDEEIVEQYILEEEIYTLRMKSQTGILQSQAVPGFAVPVRALFDETEKLTAIQTLLAET